MNFKSHLFNICLRHGLIAGALNIVLLVITFYVGRHPLMIAPYLDFRIVLFGTFVFFALREFRDTRNLGTLYFFQGMIGSYTVVFIASVVASLGLMLFAGLEKDFVVSYIEAMTAYLKGFSEQDIGVVGRDAYERNISLLPSTNSWMLAISYFGQGILIGLFVTIILSVILRKQPPKTT